MPSAPSLAPRRADAPLRVSRAIDIAAPPERVWALVGDFGELGYLGALVAGSEIVRGRNNRVGAQRLIVLGDGGRIRETLTVRRPQRRFLAYRMDDGPLPVVGYRATIRVAPIAGGSRVAWSGRFRGAGDDAFAAGLVGGIYEAGLAALKAAAER